MMSRSHMGPLAIAAACLIHAGVAWAATPQTIYDFSASQPGGVPQGAVIPGPVGSLFGVADTNNVGAAINDYVFQLTPPALPGGKWGLADIYDFPKGGQRSGYGGEQQAIGPLSADSGFTLYGVTEQGGPISRGSIYRLIPPKAGQTRWTNQELYGFKFGADGGYPYPVTVAGGAVYGATSVGGGVFRLAPPGPGQTGWQFTLLHSFVYYQSVVASPIARVVNGTLMLFGTVAGGGSQEVFQLTAPTPPATAWTYATLYSFASNAIPVAPLAADRSLNLYGVAGNFAYRLSPPGPGQTAWTFSDLHDFGGPGDALNPYTALAQYGGSLYGTSLDSYTGTQFCNVCGTVFRLTPHDDGGHTLPWNESVLFQFPTSAGPTGALTVDASDPAAISLYGPTATSIFRLPAP